MMDEQKMTGYASIDKPWLKYYTDEAINAKLPECTVYEYLWENNKEHLDDVAIEYFGRKISYRKLFESIDRTAAAFAALGVRKGDIVSLAVLASPETVFSFYALDRLGAVCNFMNVLSSADEFEAYLNEAESKVLVCWNTFYKTATEKLSNTAVKKVVVVDPLSYLPPVKSFLTRFKSPRQNISDDIAIKWSSFLSAGLGKIYTVSQYTANTPCVMAHTGGTTGIPKGVVLSDDAINMVAFQQKHARDHTRQEVFLDLIVPFVIYGLGVNIHTPLSLGFKLVLVPFFKPEEIPNFFLKYKPNTIISIPSYWIPLLSSGKLENADLSHIKLAAAGGDGMTLELENKLNDFLQKHGSDAKILNGYGLTEVCSASVASAMYARKLGSVGQPYIHNQIKIVEPNTTKELKYNQQGEICINSPCMMLGYYRNEKATADMVKVHPDGLKWVHTGDLGHIDEDGFLFLTGRIRRIILTSYTEIPSKIFPDYIEEVISRHPSVKQCCVISEPHPKYEKVAGAYIVLTFKQEADKQFVEGEIKQLCEKELPEYSRPFFYHFVDALPLTPVGKVDYRRLEDMANGK